MLVHLSFSFSPLKNSWTVLGGECTRFLPFCSQRLRLKLKPALSWSDVKLRLDREFDPDDPRRQDLYASQPPMFTLRYS